MTHTGKLCGLRFAKNINLFKAMSQVMDILGTYSDQKTHFLLLNTVMHENNEERGNKKEMPYNVRHLLTTSFQILPKI